MEKIIVRFDMRGQVEVEELEAPFINCNMLERAQGSAAILTCVYPDREERHYFGRVYRMTQMRAKAA